MSNQIKDINLLNKTMLKGFLDNEVTSVVGLAILYINKDGRFTVGSCTADPHIVDKHTQNYPNFRDAMKRSIGYIKLAMQNALDTLDQPGIYAKLEKEEE